jgi:hypothetical protein
MTTPPVGWIHVKNLAGKSSLGFHCKRCRIVIYHGITERGVFHCGKWEAPINKALEKLPLYRIERASGNGLVGSVNGRNFALIGFD